MHDLMDLGSRFFRLSDFGQQFKNHGHRDHRFHVRYFWPSLRLSQQTMIDQVGMTVQIDLQHF
ncbi:hypothetical protein D3C72_1602350 [compost metagenome]